MHAHGWLNSWKNNGEIECESKTYMLVCPSGSQNLNWTKTLNRTENLEGTQNLKRTHDLYRTKNLDWT